jgi:hypothetical protein
LPGSIRKQLSAQRKGDRKIDCDPLHAAVVNTPELGLQALAERYNRTRRMPGEKAAHGGIEGPHPDGVPSGAPRCIIEVIVEPVDDLDSEWIIEERPTSVGGRGSPAQIPQ